MEIGTFADGLLGKYSFHGRSLHAMCDDTMNPYEHAISIIGQTLSPFDDDNLIPCFGFGDGIWNMNFPITAYSGEISEIPPSFSLFPKYPKCSWSTHSWVIICTSWTIIWSIHSLLSLLGLIRVIWGIKEKTYEVFWNISLL